jgi:hypothetical protein
MLAALYHPGRLLVLISIRGWVEPRVILHLKGLRKLKKIHLIGTWTLDLLACSIAPQTTMLPREPLLLHRQHRNHLFLCLENYTTFGKVYWTWNGSFISVYKFPSKQFSFWYIFSESVWFVWEMHTKMYFGSVLYHCQI